jgi:hypothetical protein
MNEELTIEELVKYQMDTIKQTFVLDPKDEKNLYTTTNLDEWLEETKQNGIFGKLDYSNLYKQCQHHLNFDYEIIKNASGYILGPVFKYNGKVEAAGFIIFSSLQEMKESLKDKKYLLYYIMISIKSLEVDEQKLVLKPMDNPILVYTFRGHILE